MSPERIAILVLAVISVAIAIAVVIHMAYERWKQHPPIEHPALPPTLREMASKAFLPPHRSAARPSNVRTIRKHVHKSPPKAAA